jgi:DNA helicase-4
LSFTNASAAEMSERIKKETGKDIDAMTFHKLGKEIIAQVEGKQPTVTNIDLTQFVEEQFTALSKEQKYRDILLTYFLSYYKQFHSPMEFETEGEYYDYLQDNQIVVFCKLFFPVFANFPCNNPAREFMRSLSSMIS